MDVAGFLQKAADKSGFVRERYDERSIPTDNSNICILPFFGDIRSLFILSSLILRRFREEERGSKYFILASYPGFQHLFPFVDEYWAVQDENILLKLYSNAARFKNKSELTHIYYRSLNQYFFEDVIDIEQFINYYDYGLTNNFWIKYKQVKKYLPSVPSSANLGKNFNKELSSYGGYKVFVYPCIHLSSWKLNDNYQIQTNKLFWLRLIERLIQEKFVPVIYSNYLTYNISNDIQEKCIFTNEKDIGKILSIMRATGFVLDVFSGISRLAIAARCPYLVVDERARYSALKEFEIDDLCGRGLNKQYIFSFPTIIDGSPETWDHSIIDNIICRLHETLPTLDRDEWPSTGEINEIVSYDVVRSKKVKKLGTHLIKIAKG